MRQLLAMLAMICVSTSSASASASASALSLGMALQGRVQNDVNPAFYETRALGQMFGRVRAVPWSGLLEFGEERRETSSGSLGVSVRTLSVGLWGRYEPIPQYAWSPFLGMGSGLFEDHVETHLGDEQVHRTGRRYYFGGGVGISRTFLQQCLVEMEARGQFVEQSTSPIFSGLVRVGYIF